MMPEYIRVTDLSKVYRKHEAVKHISFQVGKGQIFAFLGPNGAGKSTFLRILSGVLKPEAGTVTIDELPVFENERGTYIFNSKDLCMIEHMDDILTSGIDLSLIHI